jgi:hypothetical protein
MSGRQQTVYLPPEDLVKCLKPDCMRKVKLGVAYCCMPCTIAAAGAFEIHQHTKGCDERAAERGQCDQYEALLLQQRGAGGAGNV